MKELGDLVRVLFPFSGFRSLRFAYGGASNSGNLVRAGINYEFDATAAPARVIVRY